MLSSEPSDVTEVSVVHTINTEAVQEECAGGTVGAMDTNDAETLPHSTGFELMETTTDIEQPDTTVAQIESTEKSEEAVIFCYFCLL